MFSYWSDGSKINSCPCKKKMKEGLVKVKVVEKEVKKVVEKIGTR